MSPAKCESTDCGYLLKKILPMDAGCIHAVIGCISVGTVLI